jgi:tetratricopeptide (TPR) repeat protein
VSRLATTASRRSLGLVLALVLGFGSSVALARTLDRGAPALRVALDDAAPYVSPQIARRLTAGFGGLVADWYWLTTLQYVGRKLEEQTQAETAAGRTVVELDRIKAVNPRVLVRLIELITTLDPRFTAVYEFAAIVLPAVDGAAAVALVERGIESNPDQWYLHQQLAFIYWQRGDYLAAADAFRRGARMTTATWMEHMAERMESRGDDPKVAQAMYARMYEQAQDHQVKQWALNRLMEVRSLRERQVIREVLAGLVSATGQCPRSWSEAAAALRAAGLTVDTQGPPIDPSGTPYVLVVTRRGCDVTLHRASTVPRG